MTPELEKVAKAYADKEFDLARDGILFYEGVEWTIAHLEKQAGEFDEHSAVIEGEERQDLLSRWDEPDVFADGARYQFEQCKARIGLLDAQLAHWVKRAEDFEARLAESDYDHKQTLGNLAISQAKLTAAESRVSELEKYIGDRADAAHDL